MNNQMLIAGELYEGIQLHNTPSEMAELTEYEVFHTVECEYPELSNEHKHEVSDYIMSMIRS